MKLARELATVLSLGVCLLGVSLFSVPLAWGVGGGIVFTGCLIGAILDKWRPKHGGHSRPVRTRKQN